MSLTPVDSAVQQSRRRHAPRPLPLFLELVRKVAADRPELGAAALRGLRAYGEAERSVAKRSRKGVARVRGATLRDCGGAGAPVVLVPSLINPPEVLDLDEHVSLADALAIGRRVLLLDWGPASERHDLDLAGHVETLLIPLLATLEQPPALVGYCLGGTLAIAAAHVTEAERVATIAAPWRFGAYPAETRESVRRLWDSAAPAAERLGALPMEVLQSAFWSLDPERTVSKFARFAELDAGSQEARRFVTLEDWANDGEPLPVPAARELIERCFGADDPGNGEWNVGGSAVTDGLDCPALHVTAANDRIAPSATAPAGPSVPIEAGHVGMVVGSARRQLHAALNDFLAAGGRHR